MKLGTKFTLTMSIVTGVVIASYGYYTIATRKSILISRLKREVRAIARTARISIEEAPYRQDRVLAELLDGIGQFEKTLGVFIELNGKALQSESLRGLPESLERNLAFSEEVIARGEVVERFSRYGKSPVYVYFEPLRGSGSKIIGAMGIIQHTSYLEKDIWATRLAVALTMVILIGLITSSILILIRFNISRPISDLIRRIRQVGKGEFGIEAVVPGKDELGELAEEFNEMAASLKEAEKRIAQELDRKAELEQRMRHLERLATIGQLASGLAHEIGTPLNVISGRAGQLKKGTVNRQLIEKNLDIILRQSLRITKIIKRLLNLSRNPSPRCIQTEISPAIEGALELLGHRIRRQGIKVVKRFSTTLPLIEGDPEQLQQVFLNLVHNAVQAMPNGGELVIEGRSLIDKEGDGKGSSVEIQIRDTGCGMSPEVLKDIFNPFFTTKQHGRGTGLGLPITHGIVRDHGGNISVTSEEGEGTTVRVSIPAEVPQKT